MVSHNPSFSRLRNHKHQNYFNVNFDEKWKNEKWNRFWSALTLDTNNNNNMFSNTKNDNRLKAIVE